MFEDASTLPAGRGQLQKMVRDPCIHATTPLQLFQGPPYRTGKPSSPSSRDSSARCSGSLRPDWEAIARLLDESPVHGRAAPFLAGTPSAATFSAPGEKTMRSTAIPTAKEAAATRKKLAFLFIGSLQAYFTMAPNGTLIF